MANQDIQSLELRNENNDDSPLFPNSLFTLVEEGTFNPIVIESPENLTISISGFSQKLGKDFNIVGSKINFSKEISKHPDLIFYKKEEEKDYLELDPPPSSFIESMRDIGYNLETAIADVIDNSISALAENIYINIKFDHKNNDFILEIIDDGVGMNNSEIAKAMTLGSKNPKHIRDKNDLGRFGLGLKTASFSQCRKLTVESFSKNYEEKNSLTWDLDVLEETNKWRCKINETPKIEIGTKIIWEKLDKLDRFGLIKDDLVDDSKKIQEIQLKIGEIAEVIEKHISLIFHRFIDDKNIEKNVRRIKIFLNEKKIKPFNPFNESNNATFISPLTKVYDTSMTINYFILPHKDKCKDGEYEEYAGEDGYLENQGFYVYRNYRLIIWGTWFKIIEKLNAFKLCRVKIDIGNDMDPIWNIDVKKSNASPPKSIRTFLEEYIRQVEIKGKKVIEGKIAKFSIDDTFKIWIVNKIKRSKITIFTLNRKNPLIKKIINNIENGLEIIKEIEETVPYDLINLHINDTKQIFKSNSNPNKQEFMESEKLKIKIYREDNLDNDTIRKIILQKAEFKGIDLSNDDINWLLV